ncbi:MAG: ATP cone domain-containing protein [Spirochaetia bacterium]
MPERIVKRDGRVVPFDPRKIAFAVYQAAIAVGGRDRKTAEEISSRVVETLDRRYSGRRDYPSVEEVQDQVEKELIEAGYAKTAKAYILYRYEHALKRAGRETMTYSSDNIPYRKLWEMLLWGVDNQCYMLEHIRRYIEDGSYGKLVSGSEEFYRTQVKRVRDYLKTKIDDIRLVIVSGPSSSGKTTTTIKITEEFVKEGKNFVPINADNYFFDLKTHPEDIHGDRDYETPQALDLELLNEHIRLLLSGKTVEMPRYDFKQGRRIYEGNKLSLDTGDILLIDSLHGFFEPMTESIPGYLKVKIYIETLAQIKDKNSRFIRWSDVRMLRRMVRDMQFRNSNPEETLLHWHFVRRSELHYIISRIKNADMVVNSFLPSELPILKNRLTSLFPEFLEKFKNDPEREDAYTRAARITDLFSEIPDGNWEDYIPADSLIREFIGGSCYDY